MRYREIIKEVDHNPENIRVDFDTLQTLIYLGIGEGEYGLGYADVNNYVALVGAVGHGIGKTGGVLHPQQSDDTSSTSATLRKRDYIQDYGDDGKGIAGAFNPDTGELSMNKDFVDQLKPMVHRVLGAQQATTIVHEMMHRGFQIISDTPELRGVMPEDLNGYWRDDWGSVQGDYYIGGVQASAEHAMIYAHTLGPERFTYPYQGMSWRDFVRGVVRDPQGMRAMASMGHQIVYCRLDAVMDNDSPIYGMKPRQLYSYWKRQFDLVNRGLQSYFSRSGPPRRLTRGGHLRAQEKRAQAALKRDFSDINWSTISNTAARLMGQTNTQAEIQNTLKTVFAGYAVSNSWIDTVAEMLATAVEADDDAAVNTVIQRIRNALNR